MTAEKKLKLNIGCGDHRLPGYEGVDILRGNAVDYVCDLENGNLPFQDNSVEAIYCSNVLEHIQNLPGLMAEFHRICCGGAVMEIIVPHGSGIGAFQDPTHRRFFSYNSFEYFTKNDEFPSYDFQNNFEIVNKKICFVRTPKDISDYLKHPFKAFFELTFNFFPNFYENSFLRIFPATDLRVKLRVAK